MHLLLFLYVAGAALILKILYSILESSTESLKHIPGPFLARFTRFWYARSLVQGHFEEVNINLHRKYANHGQSMASFVRIGPNMYSLATPEKVVYGIGNPMAKSDWYSVWKVPDLENLFSERSVQAHSQARRKVQAVYSLSSLLQYQSFVDETIQVYRRRLLEFSQNKKPFDLTTWMQYYAFDVIGAITYGKRFGFLEEGRDIRNMMAALHQSLPFLAVLGLFPPVFRAMVFVLRYTLGAAADSNAHMESIINAQMVKRIEQRDGWQNKVQAVEQNQHVPMDMLDKVLSQAGKDNYENVLATARQMSAQNVMAGSDTTSISLSACMYHLLRNPSTLANLRCELDESVRDGKLTGAGISFKDTQEMPHLQACIKETLRLHPASGLPMWRVVPEGGATICGQFFTAGVIVGTNSWVVHRNPDIWGLDADEYRPQRWIGVDETRKKVMEANWMPVSRKVLDVGQELSNGLFQFGVGSRTCIGRHISYLEMCKLLPVILNEFDFQLVDRGKPWVTRNWWFVKASELRVTVTTRPNRQE